MRRRWEREQDVNASRALKGPVNGLVCMRNPLSLRIKKGRVCNWHLIVIELLYADTAFLISGILSGVFLLAALSHWRWYVPSVLRVI